MLDGSERILARAAGRPETSDLRAGRVDCSSLLSAQSWWMICG